MNNTATAAAAAKPILRTILNLPQHGQRTKPWLPTLGAPTPRSSPIHTRDAEEYFEKTGRTTPSFPLTRLQNIGVNLLVKRVGELFLTLGTGKKALGAQFLHASA